jgi:hypothetical protein
VDYVCFESNIGLNAIANGSFLQHNLMPQGLGTGGFYTNNFECPLLFLKVNFGMKKVKDWQLISIN